MSDHPPAINVSQSPLTLPPGVHAGPKAIRATHPANLARKPIGATAIRDAVDEYSDDMLTSPEYGQEADPTILYKEATSPGEALLDIFGRTRMESLAECIRQARMLARKVPAMRRKPILNQHPVIQASPGFAFYWFLDVLKKSMGGQSLHEATAIATGMMTDSLWPREPEGRKLALFGNRGESAQPLR